MKYSRLTRRWVLLSAILFASCKEAAEPLVPAVVQVVTGDLQTAPVASAVPVIPSVKVLTSTGKPVPNVSVTFVPASESGTVVGGTATTDLTGIAKITSWTLGTKAGTNTLTVTAAGVAPITITATTSPGAASSIAIAQGDAQSGLVGAVMTVQPSVRISDAYGNGVPGVPVTFTAGAGSVQTANAQTNASGIASAGNWTLGTKSGVQNIVAIANTATLQGQTIIFSSTANADVAASLKVFQQPSANIVAGQRFGTQPIVEYRDRFDNLASSTAPVTASLASGTGTLGGTTTVAATNGRATFTDLSFTGTGPVQLRFASSGIGEATSSAMNVVPVAQCAGNVLNVNMQLGDMTRFITTSSTLPRCLDFTAARNGGQQYMVLFENMSTRGNSTNGLFSGTQVDDGSLNVNIRSGVSSNVSSVIASRSTSTIAPPNDLVSVDGWDFGGKPAYELQPKGSAPPAMVKRGANWISTEGSNAVINVGDTLRVQLEGIARLGAGYGTALRPVIVRFANADIVIAEDLRFFADTVTFRRSNGGRNLPLTDSVMQGIAAEYATYAKPQADRIYGAGRYNGATDQDPGRPIAVHTMMYQDNIWGYTYSSTNYFAWDYWVNSNGRTRDVYQHIQRNADDLFMHEIGHMRHYGMLQRAGRSASMGNTWLVEGWARFTERLPIAARLLGTQDYSRTGNVKLPTNPAMIANGIGNVYFFDDVPTYLNASFSAYQGYQYSSFIFDYFADQVANAGGNWQQALGDFITAGAVEADLNPVVARYLPGLDFGTLFTRARIALYLDDIGTPGLPAWTQYLQYRLRESRPPGSNGSLVDPRNVWPRFVPGAVFTENKAVDAGGSWGYILDATSLTADARVDVNPTRGSNGVMTLVRIK